MMKTVDVNEKCYNCESNDLTDCTLLIMSESFKKIYLCKKCENKKIIDKIMKKEYELIKDLYKYVFCPECKECYKTTEMPKCPTCNELIKHFSIKGAYYCKYHIPAEMLGSDYEECYKCNKLRIEESSDSEEIQCG